jgi:DNA-3-methyladenine glycosylase
MSILNLDFYNRSPLLVAPELLGKVLIRKYQQQIISGRIVETEAYLGNDDPASHAFKGKTKRNSSLYLSAGHAYIYSIHRSYCLDIVTEGINTPGSVLIRALVPLQGIELMRRFRQREKISDLTSGPGKLTQALQITKVFDGQDLTNADGELVINDDNYPVNKILVSPRIGISQAKTEPYRFYVV